MKSILVSGSLAYDYIMDFPGKFKNEILPDKIHLLNVSFTVRKLNRNFGGTAGNISYTFAMLGGKPVLLAGLGFDGKPYQTHLKAAGVSTKYVPLLKNVGTASAHIITDEDNNQITAFYPGVLEQDSPIPLTRVREESALLIIAPTYKETMLAHAREGHALGIPVVLDPGQQITSFSGEELSELVKLSTFIVANDYETHLIEKKTGLTVSAMLSYAKAVITTMGAEGSKIKTNEEEVVVPGLTPSALIDPTGAGDAYRAGFFASYVNGASLKECGQAGTLAALYAIEYHGTQNPELALAGFRRRYKESYAGASPV